MTLPRGHPGLKDCLWVFLCLCCTFATSNQAWLEEPVNHQGFPQGVEGIVVAAAEAIPVCAARKGEARQ